MKEFKPGVLVMIKWASSKDGKKYVGTPHLLVSKELCFGNVYAWIVDPPTYATSLGSKPLAWEEEKLQIIDPDDSPSEETIYAPLHKAVPANGTLKESEHV